MITFSIRTRRTFTILKIFKDWSKDAQDSSYNTPHVYKYRVFDFSKRYPWSWPIRFDFFYKIRTNPGMRRMAHIHNNDTLADFRREIQKRQKFVRSKNFSDILIKHQK